MDSIKVKTPRDFSSSSPKRKKHTTIACESCRRLRIRCHGSRGKTCNHCVQTQKDCQWPLEDGRKKKPKADISDPTHRNTPTSDETTSVDDSFTSQVAVYDVNKLSIGSEQGQRCFSSFTNCALTLIYLDRRGRPGPRDEKLHGRNPNDGQARDPTPTTIHYFRELGPTAIAPGHKQISIKVQQQHYGRTAAKDQSAPAHKAFARGQPLPSIMEDPALKGIPPLFESETSLPVKDVLPDLLDAFFTYYADNFCFLNRSYLDQLLARGEASVFLICSMAALSSRFGSPSKFAKYMKPKDDGSLREGWELSVPFLERARSLLLPLLGIPSCDVIGGMVLLSFAEFGNNSEAGKCWLLSASQRLF